MPSAHKRNKHTDEPSFFRKAFKWAFVIGMWGGIALTLLFAYYALELPSITKNATFARKASITVKAIDGSVIARYGDLKGNNIAVRDMPPNLVHAVLATEDRRFYFHPGIDFVGLARAMAVNLVHGRFVQGGSTLTQQLAKNLFLSQERTLKRKIQEAMLAIWLEYKLTKDEILSAYLNRVYMGSGAYGVEAAARVYFNKDVKDLDLQECAALAGLLKAPSRYSPLSNPGLSRERSKTVLAAMVEAGYLKPEQAGAITRMPAPPPRKPGSGNSARYYGDWIVDSMQDLIGTPDNDIIVETTMDPAIQRSAATALEDSIAKNGKDRLISQGAVIVMRPNGSVLALVGGTDYDTSQFNRATQAKRQPGSSFKPVVYLTALENGFSPQDVILDAPFTEGKYRPKNFGGEYYGPVTLETALMLSLNTVSVRLAMAVGPQKIVDMGRRLGITGELNPDLSLALGTATLAPLDMITAYGSLANGGIAVRPFAITKIESAKGELIYQRRPPQDSMRVVAPNYIAEITGMMQNVIEYGTGQRAKLPWPAYGKTGTSQDSRDAWFIGFTPELVTAVWMGNDDNSPMKKVTGGSFPADVWKQVMLDARGKYPPVRPGDVSSFNPPPPESSSGPGPFESLLARLGGSAEPVEQPPASDHPETPHYNPTMHARTYRTIPESARFND